MTKGWLVVALFNDTYEQERPCLPTPRLYEKERPWPVQTTNPEQTQIALRDEQRSRRSQEICLFGLSQVTCCYLQQARGAFISVGTGRTRHPDVVL